MKKKILALFMAVSVFMTSGSVAFAAEEINTEEVPACGTEEELTEGNFSYTVSDGQATLTSYNGTDETEVEIPEYVQGDIPIKAISSKLFYHNTIIEKVFISENLASIGNDPENVFLGATKLKNIEVKDRNRGGMYDIDGVLFFYGTKNQPVLLKYPEGKEGNTYIIPDDTEYIKAFAFYNCSNLKKIVVPSSVATVMTQGFDSLTDTTIIFQQTEPSQISFVYPAFHKCNDCIIIVKNDEMKEIVEQNLAKCTNTVVKTESELTEDERANYLTLATDLTFSDGSEVKNVTLMPEPLAKNWWDENNLPPENEDDYYWQDIYYTVSPEYSTDIVTWESTNPDVAIVKSVNGRSVVMGFSEGNCTITGTTESGKQITLNVTVQTPASKTEIKYNGINNPETTIMMQDDDTFSSSIYFRVYPYNATYRENVTWKSSNPEVLDVKKYTETVIDKTCYSHKAALTLKKPGTATITATMQDGSNTITRSVTITVTGNDDTETDSSQNNGSNTENNHDTNTGNNTDSNSGNNSSTNGNSDSGNTTVKPATKASQKITNVSSSYKKAYKTSFTLKPKAKTTCTYKSSNTKIATVSSKGKVTIKGTGKVTITITAKETSRYKKATKKVTIYAIPAKMKTPTVKAGSKKLTVSWKKDSRADGCQIQYSTSSKFKNAKTVTCSKKTVKKTIKKLKSGKKYYVRIRAYKKIGGKKYDGSYSKGKSVKVK